MKCKLVIIALLFFVMISNVIFSQNLVLNGSFERYSSFPQKVCHDGELAVDYWNSPNNGSPDHFHVLSPRMGVQNYFGTQKPHSGDSYLGIITTTNNDYGEFIQTKLTKKLKRDSYYLVSFYASLADKSSLFSKSLGALLTKEPISWGDYKYDAPGKYVPGLDFYDGKITFFTPQVVTQKYLCNKEDWVEVKGVYKAEGGEQYLTIGDSFINAKSYACYNSDTVWNSLYCDNIFTYYYIDDVTVSELAPSEIDGITMDTVSDCFNERIESDEANLLDSIYTIENVQFNFNDSTLISTSFNELDKVCEFLKSKPAIHIQIAGHTDNEGEEDYNIKLSLSRARAVCNYLIQCGIAKDRMSAVGYGSQYPISDNADEEGRALNRRVEIEIAD